MTTRPSENPSLRPMQQGEPLYKRMAQAYRMALTMLILGGCAHEEVATKRPLAFIANPQPNVALPVAAPDEQFSVFFPPDSAELPATEQARILAKCEQIRAYRSAAENKADVQFLRSAHADDLERDAFDLVKRRRQAVDQILARCAAPCRESHGGVGSDPALCDWRTESDPRDDGRGQWRQARLFKTMVSGPHMVKADEELKFKPRLDFLPDSDVLRPEVEAALNDTSEVCINMSRLFQNWQRGLLVVGYSNSSEAEANVLSARRSAAAVAALTRACHLDAQRLFTMGTTPTSDAEVANRSRRVDVIVVAVPAGDTCPNRCLHTPNTELRSSYSVAFDTGSIKIDGKNDRDLLEVCQWLKDERNSVVEVRSKGDGGETSQLAQRRMDAVARYLRACGVDPERIHTKVEGVSADHVRLNIIP